MSAPETIADVTAEMRRMMPNACGDWADRIDRAVRPQGDTLRDWFAGQAIEQCIRNALNKDGGWDADNVAYPAYDIADAMLAARSSGGEA